MKALSKEQAIDIINRADIVQCGPGTPNSETRDGIYLSTRTGISFKTMFIGLDKTSGEFVIEQVAA